MNHRISSSAFADTKPHYELLDGLRGVAALLVVFYHIFEGFSFAGGLYRQPLQPFGMLVDRKDVYVDAPLLEIKTVSG